jgi:hypothetical protein
VPEPAAPAVAVGVRSAPSSPEPDLPLAEDDRDDVLTKAGAEPDSSLEINLDLIASPAPEPVAKPAPVPTPVAPPAEVPEPRAEPTLVPFVADLVVFVGLLIAGMLVGEQLTRKPTTRVLSESFSAAKFPPVELLLWGGPPLALGLIYLLLNGRERTVGAWLRRRAAAPVANPAPGGGGAGEPDPQNVGAGKPRTQERVGEPRQKGRIVGEPRPSGRGWANPAHKGGEGHGRG